MSIYVHNVLGTICRFINCPPSARWPRGSLTILCLGVHQDPVNRVSQVPALASRAPQLICWSASASAASVPHLTLHLYGSIHNCETAWATELGNGRRVWYGTVVLDTSNDRLTILAQFLHVELSASSTVSTRSRKRLSFCVTLRLLVLTTGSFACSQRHAESPLCE